MSKTEKHKEIRKRETYRKIRDSKTKGDIVDIIRKIKSDREK